MVPIADAPVLPSVPAGSKLKFAPLPAGAVGSEVDFGVEAHNVDLEHLSDADFEALREALLTRHVVVVKGQQDLKPSVQLELNRRFDPAALSYGHGNKTELIKKSVLQQDLVSIPDTPEVKLLGNGLVKDHEGMAENHLHHPMHTTFHRDVIDDADTTDKERTRFYRWHIDAALYDLHPPRMTSLLALQVPEGRTQVVTYDDGTGDELPVSLGTTAFISGAKAYELLPPDLKSFALRTQVKYAPHPYIWIRQAKAHSTGLVMETEGKELPRSQLPEIDEAKIKVLPMVWKNPLTGRPSLQIHGCCIEDLITDGVPMGDLKKARETVYKLMRPAIDPKVVYPHEWQSGDLVLFNNWGVWHTVVGTLKPSDVRVYHQCNLAASEGPQGFSDTEAKELLAEV